jgi:hypothetical protein
MKTAAQLSVHLRVRVLALLSMTLLAGAGSAETIKFDDAKTGVLLSSWSADTEGKQKWTIEKDDTAPSKANVLKQSGEAKYPVCVLNDSRLKDGFVEVKFKPVAGEEDQAAGVVWRYRDAGNYYIARANALENNVRIYHFVNGKRTQFKGANLPVASNQWHTLRVNIAGPQFTVIFNGKELFQAEDKTFGETGKIGVWTKADSVTLFDDFSFGAQ